MNIIASFHAPKQRATIDFEIILVQNNTSYSTHDREVGNPRNCLCGHYDMTFEEGLADFAARVQRELARGPGVYEIAEEK